jgi:MoxR-like ATPase
MVETANFERFKSAASSLQDMSGVAGRVLAVYFALRFRRLGVPRLTDVIPGRMGVSDIERRILEFYRKTAPELGANDGKYLKAFQGLTFGDTTADNQFRDTLKWSSGVSCAASLNELNDPTFLATTRTSCPYATLSSTGEHGCAITGKTYMQGRDRKEWPRFLYWDHGAKLENYAVLDLNLPAIESAIREKVKGLDPNLLISAFYFGSAWHDGSPVDLERFASDFGFASAAEVTAFFGAASTSSGSIRVIERDPSARLTPNVPSDAVLRHYLALRRYGNLILEGVPGTGKTEAFFDIVADWDELAKKQGHNRQLSKDSVAVLTMHPSTSYEDFVEGLRPGGITSGVSPQWFWEKPNVPDGAVWGYADGFFLRACQRAALAPNYDHLVLLDELNRTNVPKVMGDLLTTLEASRRALFAGSGWDGSTGVQVTLPYSGRRLFVPYNLYVVATINTSDRSIATLDSALRRRFAFERIEPLPKSRLLELVMRKLYADVSHDADGARSAEAEGLLAAAVELWDDINNVLRRGLGPDALLGHSYLFGLAGHLAVACSPGNVTSLIAATRDTWLQELLPQLIDTVSVSGKEDSLFARTSDASASHAQLSAVFEREAVKVGLMGYRIRLRGEGLLARVTVEPPMPP